MRLHLRRRGLHLRRQQQKPFTEHLGTEHRDVSQNSAWAKGRAAVRLPMASEQAGHHFGCRLHGECHCLDAGLCGFEGKSRKNESNLNCWKKLNLTDNFVALDPKHGNLSSNL